ncbi:helix-turn-helix transcriptional regulator [Photorhabdus sp. CRCIA-P01]|uniref:helix-turn-helix transcriptional regulator n=1 Tax=Photorhabdus sp. CRCIA-P01 TaxID=2019570 RepID=UPI0018E5188A|nr:PAS domain-containing protein [Photorhabdus sp. CRCIA-P01]
MKDEEAKLHLISQLSAVMDAFASVAGQNIEIVLHDLSRPEASVLKIINGHISGRSPGSSLFDGPENDQGFLGLLKQEESRDTCRPEIFSDYRTTSRHGKSLRSATVVFKSESGTALASLCFNADNSAIENARNALKLLLPPDNNINENSDTGLEEKLNEIIRTCIPPAGHLRTGATKKEKVEIVRSMQEKGMFIVRGGVEKAAKVLGVTRYTIYNYLDEIRKNMM